MFAQTESQEKAVQKNPFPVNKKNNQLFFHPPNLFLWREEDNMWYPLPASRLSQIEAINLQKFLLREYEDMRYENLSLKELGADLSILLEGKILPESIMAIRKHIIAADINSAMD